MKATTNSVTAARLRDTARAFLFSGEPSDAIVAVPDRFGDALIVLHDAALDQACSFAAGSNDRARWIAFAGKLMDYANVALDLPGDDAQSVASRRGVMRTRRSPRNQDILWRALGGTAPPVTPLPPSVRCFNCRHYPKGGRDRATCALKSLKVAGLTLNAPCFERRPGKGD